MELNSEQKCQLNKMIKRSKTYETTRRYLSF